MSLCTQFEMHLFILWSTTFLVNYQNDCLLWIWIFLLNCWLSSSLCPKANFILRNFHLRITEMYCDWNINIWFKNVKVNNIKNFLTKNRLSNWITFLINDLKLKYIIKTEKEIQKAKYPIDPIAEVATTFQERSKSNTSNYILNFFGET